MCCVCYCCCEQRCHPLRRYLQYVVIGERDNKIRQAFTAKLATIFERLQRCAHVLKAPQLSEVTSNEPRTPLPGGRLQQTQAPRVTSHLRGGSTIVDLGFSQQGLTSIEFCNEVGPTLSDAVKEVAVAAKAVVVRLEGSTIIDGIRRSVIVKCYCDSPTLRYQVLIDGEDISALNPVSAVAAAAAAEADTGSANAGIVPYTRIAQYVIDTPWWEERGKQMIADTADQVAAAVDVEWRIRDQGDAFSGTFDVLNSIVYWSSKELLDHLPRLRGVVVGKWRRHVGRYKHERLAAALVELLAGDTRVLALSNDELRFAREMLAGLRFVVDDVHVDNQSYSSKSSDLAKRSKYPSISFVHFLPVGHVDAEHIQNVCEAASHGSLRLLVVASPSTQHFSRVPCVGKTDAAVEEFRSSRVAPLKSPVVVARGIVSSTLASTLCAQAMRDAAERCNADTFVRRVLDSKQQNRLTLICRRRQAIPYQLDQESRGVNDAGVRAACTTHNVLMAVEHPRIDQALFVHNERTIQAQLMWAPVPVDATGKLHALVQLPPQAVLSPAWANIEARMVLREGCALGFEDFIREVPMCEWLDHRRRVQLYLAQVWNVPLELAEPALGTIRNVTSLPLAETLLVTDQRLAQRGRDSVEVAPSYNEMKCGGIVTLRDVVLSCFSVGSDIPWNVCEGAWSAVAPFSSEELTQILSVYPFRLRLLTALGPSVFHTLCGVDLFLDGKPLSWASEVARRIYTATALMNDGLLSKDHLATLSVVKWLFMRLGWSDAASPGAVGSIRFDAEDFAALDRHGIVMDILEVPHEAHAQSRSLSARTRHAILLMLATITGSPSLFTKQPHIVHYFLTPHANGGIDLDNATQLMRDLLNSSSDTGKIGAPFLSILIDSTLLASASLRRGVPEVDTLWKWCNTAGSQGAQSPRILDALSLNAWAFLMTCSAGRAGGNAHTSTAALVTPFCSTPRPFSFGSLVLEVLTLTEVAASRDAATIAILVGRELLAGDVSFRQSCASQKHLLQLLDGTLLSPMECARSRVGSEWPLFLVELDAENVMKNLLVRCFPISVALSNAEDFPAQVLFFSRCLTDEGRRSLLRFVTRQLLHASPNDAAHTSDTLEVAAASLWLLLPMCPSPLTVTSKNALVKMKRFLDHTFDGSDGLVTLHRWGDVEVADAHGELRRVAESFKRWVTKEYEIAPPIALGLVKLVHYLPLSLLKTLCDVGVVDNCPEELTTNIVVQGGHFPAYTLLYAMRPLPAAASKDYLKRHSYSIDAHVVAYDISHGVSKDVIRQNLSFFAMTPAERVADEESTASKLCVVLWFQSLGLFAGCRDAADCEARIVDLAASANDRMLLTAEMGLFKRRLARSTESLRRGFMVKQVTFPSFMELQVLRTSALLRLFDTASQESVQHTLQLPASVLDMLPEETSRPSNLFLHEGNINRFAGAAFLTHLVLERPSDGERVSTMGQCIRVIACEAGYRLGSSWSSLSAERQLHTAHSVVNLLFHLVGGFPARAKEILLIIADVAMERLTCTRKAFHRAQLFSALVMAIGFQHQHSNQHLLYPLLELMEGVSSQDRQLEGIIRHTRTPCATDVRQRAFLTKSVMGEVLFWAMERRQLSLPNTFTIPPGGGFSSIFSAVSIDDKYPTRTAFAPDSFIVDCARIAPPEALAAGTDDLSDEHSTNSADTVAASLPQPNGNSTAGLEGAILFRTRGDVATVPPTAASVAAHLIDSSAMTNHSEAPPSDASICVLDVSSLLAIDVPKGAILTGGRVHVRAGLRCALLRLVNDDEGILRVVPCSDISKYPNAIIRCHFQDHGEAWAFVAASPPPDAHGERLYVRASSHGGMGTGSGSCARSDSLVPAAVACVGLPPRARGEPQAVR